MPEDPKPEQAASFSVGMPPRGITPSHVSNDPVLSPQDRVNLYEVLQTIAQALRRIRHEDNQATKQQQ